MLYKNSIRLNSHSLILYEQKSNLKTILSWGLQIWNYNFKTTYEGS